MTAPQPSLVAWSAPVTESLGLAAEECETDAFLRTFRQLAAGRPRPLGDGLRRELHGQVRRAARR